MQPFLETIYDPGSPIRGAWPDLPRRKTLIAVPDEPSVTLATVLFSKMFDKLGLTFDEEAAILTVGERRCTFAELKRQVGFERVILCGVPPSQLGLQSECPVHVPLQLGNTFLLRTEKPSGLEAASRESKTAFWLAFQKAFEA